MIAQNIIQLKTELPANVSLVAVSKTKPLYLLQEAYNAGQRAFGENKVQEMCEKYEQLPKDIQWHMIGHLQSNKVKYLAPFVHLIHGVDSPKLLAEISKQALKANRTIDCLLQVHVAMEETKFGFSVQELQTFITETDFEKSFPNVRIQGLMAMASNVSNAKQIKKEFGAVKQVFDTTQKINKRHVPMQTLSMGMSGDYKLAIETGSNMIRVGSSIFGNRI